MPERADQDGPGREQAAARCRRRSALLRLVFGGEHQRARRAAARRTYSRRGRRAGAVVARLGGLDLALVVAAELGVPVGALRRPVERHERQLGDRQAGPQLDRDAREVVELERQRALPARVAEAGGRVDDQPEAPERGLALDPRDDVVRQLDPLRACARGRTRRGGSRTARPRATSTCSVRFVGGSRRSIAVTRWLWKTRNESPSRRSTLAGCTMRRVPRVDLDPAVLDQPADRPVGEDGGRAHRGPVWQRRRGAGARPARLAGCRARRTTLRVRAGGGGAGAPCGPRRGLRGERAARVLGGRARAAVAFAAAARRRAPDARPTRRCTAARAIGIFSTSIR